MLPVDVRAGRCAQALCLFVYTFFVVRAQCSVLLTRWLDGVRGVLSGEFQKSQQTAFLAMVHALAAAAALAVATLATVTPRSALAISLPYRIDQTAHTVSTEDVNGFSAGRLAGFGVNVVVGGGLDGSTYLTAIPGGPWWVPRVAHLTSLSMMDVA